MENMGFSDDQIHDILELKEQLAEKIAKHLEEIEKLEKNISVLNTILKQTSFTKASDLTLNTEKKKEVVPIIKNYRQKERVDEIINTATWSLTRMLENSV